MEEKKTMTFEDYVKQLMDLRVKQQANKREYNDQLEKLKAIKEEKANGALNVYKERCKKIDEEYRKNKIDADVMYHNAVNIVEAEMMLLKNEWEMSQEVKIGTQDVIIDVKE